ncbi:MAG: hypothetical protein KBD31_02095, partial [Proteobacteria bacterium]|nr:hypothetical protein [Pseudomonadota bacterium]
MFNNLYAIDINLPYLKTLGDGIVNRFNQSERPYVSLLLPSERAILNFQTAFIQNHQNDVLPKLYSFSAYFLKIAHQNGHFFETISSLERFHVLFNLLKAKLKNASIDHVKTLTFELISLMDEVYLSSKTKNDLLNVLSFSKSTTPHTALLFDVVKNYKNYLKDKNIYDEKEALQKMCSITIE